MKGHGEKLTRKADDLIVALLAHDSISAAARAINIGEKTAHRWLALPEFQREYRAARRQLVEQSLAALQSATVEAVECLRRNLTCEKPNVEVSAAVAIIGQAIKAVELVDLEERLSELESRTAATSKANDRREVL